MDIDKIMHITRCLPNEEKYSINSIDKNGRDIIPYNPDEKYDVKITEEDHIFINRVLDSTEFQYSHIENIDKKNKGITSGEKHYLEDMFNKMKLFTHYLSRKQVIIAFIIYGFRYDFERYNNIETDGFRFYARRRV